MVADQERQAALRALELERESVALERAVRSAVAHARMEAEGQFNNVPATGVDWQSVHPEMLGPQSGIYAYTPPQHPLQPWSDLGIDFPIWQDVAPDDASIDTVFRDFVSPDIIQATCVNCHAEGLLGAVSSDLTLIRNPNDGTQDYIDANKRALQALVEAKGADHVLNKVQAIGGHGGGVVVRQGTDEFANLERFLRGEESGSVAPTLTAENLFEGVTMESPARTLWRAAIADSGRTRFRAVWPGVEDAGDYPRLHGGSGVPSVPD